MKKSAILMFLLVVTCHLSLMAAPLYDRFLKQLDQAVGQNAALTKARQSTIQHLKNNFRLAVLPTDRYLSCEQIAVAYSQFDSDSAVLYYHKCYQLGVAAHNKVWMDNAIIKQAYIYAERGDNLISFYKLNSVGDIAGVYPSLQKEYAKSMMNNYVRSTSFTSKIFNTSSAETMWQIYGRYIPPTDPEYLIYYSIVHPDYNAHRMIRLLKRQLAATKAPSPTSGALQMQLFLAYDKLHQREEALSHIIQAAYDNLLSCNKSSSSMLRLVEYLNTMPREQRSLRRENSYLEVCMENVSRFKDVGRSIHLVELQKQIVSEYQHRLHRNRIYLYLVTALLGVLAAGLAVSLWKRRRQLHTLQAEASGQQQLLATLQTSLETTARQLAQASARCDKFDTVMAQQFELLSMFLKDIKTCKRDLSNLITSGQQKEARKMIQAAVMKDQTTDAFYRMFDRNFLFIYPQFVARFNAAVKPELRTEPSNDHNLTPEQRIYALISLGIKDSRNIADILQYSIQTVYNYRMKVRHGCIDEKLNLDEYVASAD